MKKILLIEDDAALRASLVDYLSKHDYSVTPAASLAAVRSLALAAFHLILLDWELPDGEGLDWLREARARGENIPIFFLTARSELGDKLRGFESGAQDYLTKPFEPRELLARIRARLAPPAAPEILVNGPFRLSVAAFEAHYADRPLTLTKMEFELLRLFLAYPGRAFSREELLNRVWGYERTPTTRTVDTHILMLRGKTDERHFETVRGLGYKFVGEKTSLPSGETP